MKIQDMRSGIVHLTKRMEREGQENYSAAAAQSVAEPEVPSELDEPRWSVVSFDKREAGGLTYRQAANLMAVLEEHGTHGLCIITDAAAKRYGR
jgi:hypothetical protein